MSNNIDLFNMYVGAVFAETYEHFPLPIKIDCQKVVSDLLCANENTPSSEIHKRHMIASATVEWLIKEGYVEGQQKGSQKTIFKYVVLTSKAFHVLSAREKDGPSIGTQMVDIAKDASTTAKSATISELVGIAIGSAMKAFSNP
ncbi:MAG: hypothetical protein ABJN57_00490 [Hyphomicrobiales bacterium]